MSPRLFYALAITLAGLSAQDSEQGMVGQDKNAWEAWNAWDAWSP